MRSHHWQLLLSGAVAALSGAALAACEDRRECAHEAQSYPIGATFDAGDGCNSCTCTESGAVCTELACVLGCDRAGATYEIGQEVDAEDGCNTCTCTPEGTFICTELACEATCEANGAIHAPGSEFPAGDGCNYCTCENGAIICSDSLCDQCIYGGAAYGPGETFASLDGCVSCQCVPSGSGGGTSAVECPPAPASCCDPASEWMRRYLANEPASCSVPDALGCVAPTVPFVNDCGCGCEQPSSCPRFFDCTMQPCNADAIFAECPYSEVLE
jgi:hypothetical protein